MIDYISDKQNQTKIVKNEFDLESKRSSIKLIEKMNIKLDSESELEPVIETPNLADYIS